jgi:hypothetical protein
MAGVETTEMIRAPQGEVGDFVWELSGLDQPNLWLLLRGLWVFEGTVDEGRLKESLSRLLALYPHVAGRMEGRRVVANNQGVPLTVRARPELFAKDIKANFPHVDRLAPSLKRGRVKRGSEALFKAMVTTLADGWVLGVRATHACLDGNSFYTMINNWSRLHRGESVEAPLLNQSLIPSAGQRAKAEALKAAVDAGWVKLSVGKVFLGVGQLLFKNLTERTAPVHFSPEALRRLKRKVAAEALLDQVGTNVALSAHLTYLCSRLYDHPAAKTCVQVTVVDARERLATVPANFVGNAAFPAASPPFGAQASLGEIAATIDGSLRPLTARPSSALQGAIELALATQQHKLLMLPYDVTAMHSPRPTVTYINNFSKLPIYDVDFGDANQSRRPLVNIPHNLPDPVLIWPAPPTRGGVDVFFTGVAARAVQRLEASHPWWSELHQFES